MKNPVICILVALLLLVAAGLAQAEYENAPNAFGLTFDLDYVMRFEFQPPFTTIDVYLTLDNVTVPSLDGWEAAVGIHGTALLIGRDFAGGGVNSGDEYQYLVSCPEPLVCSATTVPATLTLLPLDDNTTNCIGLSAVSGIAGSQSATGLAIEVERGAFVEVVARVFDGSNVGAQLNGSVPIIGGGYECEGVVAAESSTWGFVKALYR